MNKEIIEDLDVEKEENIKEKKKKKIKKPILIILILLLIVLFSTSGYLIYINLLTNNIKNNYSDFVKTIKNTNIYDKDNNKIGTITKNITLELNKIKNIDQNNKYFNIKDTEYKIYYKDVEKTKNSASKETKNYLVFNLNIKTNKPVKLLKDGKEAITLDKGLNTAVEYIKDNKYYITYFNELYSIEKNDNIEEIEVKNNENKEAKFVSVINHNTIEENCSAYECTTINNIKEQINKLKEASYNFISKEEYLLFIENGMRLKENSVLLTTNNLNDTAKNISKELNVPIELFTADDNINFVATNKKSKKNEAKEALNRYEVKSYSTTASILRMAKGEEVYEADPNYNRNNQKIAVLNYHFFYDPTIGESCNEIICLTTQKFEEHLTYFRDNGFKTVTMNEFVRWYDGEIDLPPKSVLITVDDGAMGTGAHNGNHLIRLLEKYDMHATLFLIAGWWDINNYISPNLDIQSHTFDMHLKGTCGKGQLVCYDYEKAKQDIQKSLDIIGNNDSFCYPFYDYSDRAIQVIKDLGFQVAFAGGNQKASRLSNRYIIPRYPIYNSHGVDYIQRIVN